MNLLAALGLIEATEVAGTHKAAVPRPAFERPGPIPGLPITPGIIEIWERETLSDGQKPPNLNGADSRREVIEWLRATPIDSARRLPRYFEAVYIDRPDLRAAFPEVDHGDLEGLRWWSHLWGRHEESMLRLLGHRVPSMISVDGGCRVPGGVDVVGFFTAEHGIGEAARLLVSALRAADVSTSTVNYRNTASRQGINFPTDDVGRYQTVVSAINAELNEPFFRMAGSSFFDGAWRIGQWFWELEKAPPWYRDAYRFVDELWAPTRFIEEMLRREAPPRVTITHMPLPLRRPRPAGSLTKRDLGIGDRFMYLFTFDFMSVMKRKNPLGLVEAFTKAFRDGEGPVLYLKSINAGTRPREAADLQRAIQGRSDIMWNDGYLNADVAAALMNNCDCYVSLHRSEGLGLTIAEAMLLGKPVIATGYSGNMDFMTPATALAVPWRKTWVGKGADAYSRWGRWVEPDIGVAAEMMRHVHGHQAEAREMGQRAKADLEVRFAPATTGARMRSRLAEIEGRRS